jgi:beta-lactamase regulating signal transducer with metallopeptidase domain
MTEADVILNGLIDTSVRGAVIAVAVGAALVALRVRNASVRHSVWSAVVAAMLILPVAPRWLPSVPLPVPSVPRTVEATEVDVPDIPTASMSSPVAPSQTQVRAQPLAATVATVRSTPSPVESRLSWPVIVLSIWVAGVAIMFLRFGLGWWYASKLISTTRARADGIYESELVATPVVAGVWNPRVVVPMQWSHWPEHQRQAVIIHERAHIERRDSVVDFLARVNRCIYWFHPLAWWLDRHLAIAAEEACDDEVIRRMGEPRRYAGTLVQMADAARLHGGRIQWQAVGMAGASLHSRIDRVLSGRAALTTPFASRLAIAVICGAIIVPGIACQQMQASALAPNPDVAAQLKRNQERVAEWEAAKDLTLPQVAELEAKASRDPDDLVVTRQLVTFYTQSGQKLMGWNAMVAARRVHLLRLIERHPDSDSTFWPLKQSYDPEGWAQARALWMQHVSAPSVTTQRLARAAAFFAISEKPMAEELLLRAQKMEPNGPQPRTADHIYNPPWTSSLGRLYARAIVGSDDDMLFNVVRSVSLAESRNAFAKSARAKLDESKDAAMLRAAGQLLVYAVNGRRDGKIGDQNVDLGFDYAALGESYLDRAAALDPDSDVTRQLEASRRQRREHAARQNLLETKFSKTMLSVTPEEIKTLPDADQLVFLPELASDAHMWSENIENTTKDSAKFAEQLARAKGFANALLAVADRAKSDPRSKPAAYEAHLSLGLAALREGNRKEAVAQLQAAAASIAGGDLRETSFPSMEYRLTNYLLKDGERDSVASFFEQVSKVPGPDQQRFDKAAKAIRAGEMPEQFQRAMTR